MSGPQFYGQAQPQAYGQLPPTVDDLPPGAVLIQAAPTHLPPGVTSYAPAPMMYDKSAPPPNEFATHAAEPTSYDFDESPQHLHMSEAPTFNQPGRWKHGLCGCECKGECCISFWLHPLQTAKLHSWVNHTRPATACASKAPTYWTVAGLVLWGIGSVVSGVVPYAGPVGLVGSIVLGAQHCHVRSRVGRELGIDEGCCQICIAGTICCGCSSAQMTESIVRNGEPAARLFMS